VAERGDVEPLALGGDRELLEARCHELGAPGCGIVPGAEARSPARSSPPHAARPTAAQRAERISADRQSLMFERPLITTLVEGPICLASFPYVWLVGHPSRRFHLLRPAAERRLRAFSERLERACKTQLEDWR
jgi:hypothetical protein